MQFETLCAAVKLYMYVTSRKVDTIVLQRENLIPYNISWVWFYFVSSNWCICLSFHRWRDVFIEWHFKENDCHGGLLSCNSATVKQVCHFRDGMRWYILFCNIKNLYLRISVMLKLCIYVCHFRDVFEVF